MITGGVGVALVTALGAAAPQLWQSYLEYKVQMTEIEKEACTEHGLVWVNGECVIYGPVKEE